MGGGEKRRPAAGARRAGLRPQQLAWVVEDNLEMRGWIDFAFLFSVPFLIVFGLFSVRFRSLSVRFWFVFDRFRFAFGSFSIVFGLFSVRFRSFSVDPTVPSFSA